MPRRKYPARRRVVGRQRKLNKRQKTQVKRLIGRQIESKVADTNVFTTVDASGSFVQRLNMPAQGDAYNERGGDVIHVEKLQWKFNMTAADNTNVMRMIILRWQNDSGIATPSVTDILEGVSPGPLAFHDYQSQSSKIQVLYDRAFALSLNGTPSRVITGSLYGRKLGRKKIQFNQAATTGVDQFYLFLISDSTAVTHPGFGGFFRLTYSDA